MAEDVYVEVTGELQWQPRRPTEVVLVDRTDAANGYAMSLPYNQIVLFVTAPQSGSSLDHYEGWTRAVFTHELTHIVHLDTNHNLTRAARVVVGRVASTNRLSPAWVVEGLATFEETKLSGAGRGRSPLADMVLRAAVADDAFPRLGDLDGFQAAPPAGNLRYLFGEDLMSYTADYQGEEVWTRFSHTYGGGIPYWLPGHRALGKRLVPLYRDWRADRIAKYGAQVARVVEEGLIEGELVSDGVSSCGAPAFAPDGAQLAWSCLDRKRGSALWLADGEGHEPTIALKDHGASQITWRADSEAFAFAGTHVVNRFNAWSDIYLYTLGDEHPIALTSGARARDPELSPDGSKLLVVTNLAQQNQLEVLTIDRQRAALTANTDHTQYGSPRYSPNGSVIATSLWRGGMRDLWLLNPDGTPLRQLTSDIAGDRDPVWSADGEWLYFVSDRSGIPNVYAVDMSAEHLYQVTNVRIGAASPSPSADGARLAYQQYSADGWDVRLLALDPTRFLDRGPLPFIDAGAPSLAAMVGQAPPAPTSLPEWTGPTVEPAPAPPESAPELPTPNPLRPLLHPYGSMLRQSTDGIDSYDQAHVDDVFGDELDYAFSTPPKRYNPLPTLLPRYWVPWVQATPHAFGTRGPLAALPGFQVTAAAGSSDPLRYVAWGAGATYRSDADAGGGYAQLELNRFLPTYAVGARTQAVPYVVQMRPMAPRPLTPTDAPPPVYALYWERRREAWASVSYPYSHRATLFGRYSLTERTPLRGAPRGVLASTLPSRGTLGEVSAGWRYAWAQSTVEAVSLEDGRIVSLVGSALLPQLGTQLWLPEWDVPPLTPVAEPTYRRQPITQVQLSAELREYIVNPLAANHVLALRGSAGLSVGQAAQLARYRLGGSLGDSAFYAKPDGSLMLRGYPLGAVSGDMFWLTSAEYRFPIHR